MKPITTPQNRGTKTDAETNITAISEKSKSYESPQNRNPTKDNRVEGNSTQPEPYTYPTSHTITMMRFFCALLFLLKSSLDLNEKVKPVALPEKDQEFTGDAVVSGWGTIYSDGPSSPLLRSVTVQIVSDEDCSDAYPGSTDETMICAAAAGKDSCQGDSGGPLAQDGTLRQLIFGNDHFWERKILEAEKNAVQGILSSKRLFAGKYKFYCALQKTQR
ncbi:PRSS1_2_3 [Lepeophtheirus salmonis]|uniref:PRSS1_2_3 n=1 Tax=Lepeophtheirus salmonis TaxID=72036 RepID=A0A7R8CZT8_LEPSM|nr:PRSS1_2_3 [Lepeophtheirus salmonis]CAF2977974.1 PRSS1_2_3 [Lepeophtheirus salmonis]